MRAAAAGGVWGPHERAVLLERIAVPTSSPGGGGSPEFADPESGAASASSSASTFAAAVTASKLASEAARAWRVSRVACAAACCAAGLYCASLFIPGLRLDYDSRGADQRTPRPLEDTELRLKLALHCGFLKLYQRLRVHRRVPLPFASTAHCLVLLLATWPQFSLSLGPYNALRIIVVTEVVALALLLIHHSKVLKDHSAGNAAPDVDESLRAPLLIEASGQRHGVGDGVGGGMGGAGGVGVGEVGDVCERQAELISFLHDGLRALSKELLHLQARLRRAEGDGGGIGVKHRGGGGGGRDVEHLLGVREAELRALAAEREHLLADIRGAKHLQASRDAEIEYLKVVNQQHMDENSRLRAMLEEWSTRTAKLEALLQRPSRTSGSSGANASSVDSRPPRTPS
eukprot:jgi/Chlat1/4342/Chrsp29S00347